MAVTIRGTKGGASVNTTGQTVEDLGKILEKLRLEWNLSYGELDEHIYQMTHLRRDADTWRKFCLGHTKRPHATTTYIVKAFLAVHDMPRGKRIRKHQSRTSARPGARRAS